jgi:glycosyltransferase involved in cell wall biosynthesis
MCFDAHSSVERKNPLAAVRAFLAAFPNVPNAHLIIKTTPVDPLHWGDPNQQMHQIRTIARRDPRVIVDARMLPFNDLLALIKRADCIVSPHRAEGFGYIPAYALWYARPVIVTDYSGTQEICTHNTAHPVSYKLVSTNIGETIIPLKNAKWAEIDVDALANTMRKVRDDPLKAQIKALRGQKLLRTKFTPQMQAKRYLDRLNALGVVEV